MSASDTIPEPSDVIVIGSGFGGSACATRLVEAGLKVLLIERGPWRDTVPVRSMGISARAPFPRGRRALLSLVRTLRNSWIPGGSVTLNRKGLFDIYLGSGLHVVCSSGVGGGSHVYSGLNVRPPDPEYWNSITPELSAERMEPSYERVFERMAPRPPMADDCLPHGLAERFGANAAFDVTDADHELSMGLAFAEMPGAPRRTTTADGIERWEARPGEDGNLGSEGGGKTSVDFAFLAAAMRQGLKVLDLCEVQTIRRAEQGYAVDFINHHGGRRETRRARRVVVAAGTLNTLRLLLHAQARHDLAPMRGLGERFGGNGDFFGYWKLDDVERDLSQAMPVHGLVRSRDPEALGAGRPWPMIAEGTLPSPRQLPLGRWVSRMLQRGSFVAGMGADAQDGRVSYRGGRLRINYRPERSEIFQRIKQAFRWIGEKSGRRIYHFETPITVHPTGGACIGADPESGVVDSQGEVFGNPGLYVADAAAFPRPVSGPPSMTIAAWGDYVARGIVTAQAVRQPL